MLLRDQCFDSAKILAIAGQNDLSADVDFQLLQTFVVFRRTIVGVHNFGFCISGGRHTIERDADARIVLKRIHRHMFRGWAMHRDVRRSRHIHVDFERIVHPDAVFDGFGFQPSFAELLRDIVGGCLILDRTSHVRSLGQSAQMGFRQSGVGYGEEFGFDFSFSNGIAKAQQIRGGGHGFLFGAYSGLRKQTE